MSETMEYEGLIRGMGDLVFDNEDVGESLYHYDESIPRQQAPSQMRRQMQQARQQSRRDDLGEDAQPQTAAPRPAAAPAATVSPKRGLKTPVILGLSAGAIAAAGVYGYLRWKRPDDEEPVKLAGVAGGVSGIGVLVTVLAARGLGALDRGQSPKA